MPEAIFPISTFSTFATMTISVWGLVTEKTACMETGKETYYKQDKSKVKWVVWQRNFLAPAGENTATAPSPGWGDSHLASSQQESTSHSPELRPPYLGPPSCWRSLRASDAPLHGSGPHGSLQKPFSLLVHRKEPAIQRRVRSKQKAKLFLSLCALTVPDLISDD